MVLRLPGLLLMLLLGDDDDDILSMISQLYQIVCEEIAAIFKSNRIHKMNKSCITSVRGLCRLIAGIVYGIHYNVTFVYIHT